MARHYEDPDKMRAALGSNAMAGHVCWFIAIIFVIVGIIGDAANANLGLEPTSWFLLAIVAFLAGITYFIGWAISWYLTINK